MTSMLLITSLAKITPPNLATPVSFRNNADRQQVVRQLKHDSADASALYAHVAAQSCTATKHDTNDQLFCFELVLSQPKANHFNFGLNSATVYS